MSALNNNTNNEKILDIVNPNEFFSINILDPIAYGDNQKYYNPWLRTAFKGRKGRRWDEMINRYDNDDIYDDMHLKVGDNKYIRINPNYVEPSQNGGWGKYTYMEDGVPKTVDLTDLNIFYRHNPGTTTSTTGTSNTSTPTGSYLHLNDKTAPANTPNYDAYTYSEWSNDKNPWARNVENIRSLGNIYGDIDTAEELGILAQLQGAQNAINYINTKAKKSLFDNSQFTGNADDVKRAAALLGQYATTAEGKPFYEQLRRGYASLDNMDKYAAYDAVKDWKDINGKGDAAMDKHYLNEALNSRDKRYRGAQFFRKYAGDKTWGNLANQFARNNRFRDDYTVDENHVKDRLNRDAGLGNGRKLIDIYNDIIKNSPNIKDEQAYAIFRDMTRRRFKMDNDFWNRHATYLSGIRDKVVGADEVIFKKEGGQIFNMLFV